MSFELNLPSSLKDVNHNPPVVHQICDLTTIDITTLSPSERNRLFTQYSGTDGRVTPDLRGVADSWSNYVVSQNQSRFKPAGPEEIKKESLPRSHLIDSFFSHQLPGVEDSILTDVRYLVKLQSRIQRTADHASRQIKLAMHHMQQIASDPKSLQNFIKENENPIDSIQKMVDEDEPFKPIHCNPKALQSTVSVILENTENITADFTNGKYVKADAPTPN